MGQGGWRGSGLGGGQAEGGGQHTWEHRVLLAGSPGHALSLDATPNLTTGVPSQSQGFLERGLGKGSLLLPHGWLFSECICQPFNSFLQILAWSSPAPRLYIGVGPVPKSQGREVGGPASAKKHAPLLPPRPPAEPEYLSLQ